MEQLNGQIMLAAYLIQLGKITFDDLRGFFSGEGHDDEKLAAIQVEVEQRLARRG